MYIYILISIIFLIFSILIGNKNKFNLILFPFIGIIFFLFSDIYIVSNYFTGEGINESIIYHIFYGLEGAGLKSNYIIILIGLFTLILGFIFGYLIYRYIKKNLYKAKINNYSNFFSFLIIFISFIIHPLSNNILQLNGYYIQDYIGINKNKTSNININFDDYYKTPIFEATENKKKNLIFIYLESFENLYLDKNLFPGIANGLNELKDNSIYFNNIKQGYSAARTIAGMVASQCGLPLITPGGVNSVNKGKNYLAGATCMGDYLKKAGYNLNFMGGASLEFAGKGNFYKTHGFNSVEGKDELLDQIDNKNYVYDWGLYDDKLFDLAYEKYNKLSSSGDNFGLFLINMDTHGDKGVISNKCKNLNYGNNNSIINTYNCTDFLVSDFIKKIKNNVNYKNTSIVIASDHLAMDNNNSSDILKKNQNDRRLLFLIIDPDNKENNEISKNGSTLDIGATVLSNIGFDVNQLGLGFNLLSNSGYTITDQNPNIIFSKWREKYKSFWNYPK